MDEQQFWTMIELSLERSGGRLDAQEAALGDILAALPPRLIVEYETMYAQMCDRAYRWDLWAAAYLVAGGCSDDGFIDFRAWLISRGRTIYDKVLADPDNLADVEPGDDFFFESFAYIARRTYEKVAGSPFPDPPYEAGPRLEPAKPGWNYDFDNAQETARCLPRLWAKYGRHS